MKNNNQILIIGLLALAGFALSRPKEQTFNVPGRGPVPESQLPGLGYVKFQGTWMTQQDFIRLQSQFNQQQNQPSGFANFAQYFALFAGTATSILQAIDQSNLFGNNSGQQTQCQTIFAERQALINALPPFQSTSPQIQQLTQQLIALNCQ